MPVHGGASFIEMSIRAVLEALEGLDQPIELLVVFDGVNDAAPELAATVDDERVRVLAYPRNQGKGFAITHGIAHSRGRLVGWLDSDLDIHPSVIVEALELFDGPETVDAVIGSKRHPDSEVHYPWRRRVYSAGYQVLTRLLFRINVRDTQVGAKLFRREMLETVAPLLLVKRYAFDVEVLAVGAEFGFDRVSEVPISLDYRFSGSLINRHAVYKMLVDTLAIAYRIHIRHWYVRRFASLERGRMDMTITSPARVSTSPRATSSVQPRDADEGLVEVLAPARRST